MYQFVGNRGKVINLVSTTKKGKKKGRQKLGRIETEINFIRKR